MHPFEQSLGRIAIAFVFTSVATAQELIYELHGSELGAKFGTSVPGVGDVDGDGRADLLVGEPVASAGTGRAILYSGASGSVSAVVPAAASGHALTFESRAVHAGRRSDSVPVTVVVP